jgi:hypothetical protein
LLDAWIGGRLGEDEVVAAATPAAVQVETNPAQDGEDGDEHENESNLRKACKSLKIQPNPA